MGNGRDQRQEHQGVVNMDRTHIVVGRSDLSLCGIWTWNYRPVPYGDVIRPMPQDCEKCLEQAKARGLAED